MAWHGMHRSYVSRVDLLGLVSPTLSDSEWDGYYTKCIEYLLWNSRGAVGGRDDVCSLARGLAVLFLPGYPGCWSTPPAACFYAVSRIHGLGFACFCRADMHFFLCEGTMDFFCFFVCCCYFVFLSWGGEVGWCRVAVAGKVYLGRGKHARAKKNCDVDTCTRRHNCFTYVYVVYIDEQPSAAVFLESM